MTFNATNPLELDLRESGVDLGFDTLHLNLNDSDMLDRLDLDMMVMPGMEFTRNPVCDPIAASGSSVPLTGTQSAQVNVNHLKSSSLEGSYFPVESQTHSQTVTVPLAQSQSTLGTTDARQPSFKSPSLSRTTLKQHLMREKLLEEEKREATLHMKATQASASVPFQSSQPSNVDVPLQILQVTSRLENPTDYHMRHSQQRQVRQYLSQSCVDESGSSVPQSTNASPCLLPRNVLLNSRLQGNLAVSAPPTLTTTPLSPTDIIAPASLSSLATSLTSHGSEADLLEEILDLETGEGDLNQSFADLKCGTELIGRTPLSPEDQLRFNKDRQKKDNHNMIERRRRFNINDRIKELATLLPRHQADPYFEEVGEFRPNKGTILKASVDFIRVLKGEADRFTTIQKRNEQLEHENRKLMLRIQQLENGVTISDSSRIWKPAATSLLNTLVKSEEEVQVKKEPVDNCCGVMATPTLALDDLMDDDSGGVMGTGDPMLTQTIESMAHHLSDGMDF